MVTGQEEGEVEAQQSWSLAHFTATTFASQWAAWMSGTRSHDMQMSQADTKSKKAHLHTALHHTHALSTSCDSPVCVLFVSGMPGTL